MAGKSRSVSRGTKVVLYAAAAASLLASFGCSAKVSGKTASDRKAAVCSIADERPAGAVEALVRTAEKDQEADVRQAAVVGLGRFDSPDARQAVERALADPSPKVRTAAAGTLGLFGDPAAADRLGALAASEATLAERKASVLGLARCESERSIVWLLETAEKTADDSVKLAAIRELYKKLGMRYVGAGSGNQTQWLDNIELTKLYPQVQRAYLQAGRPLERHPENLRVHYEPSPAPRPTSAPGVKQP
jgi:HEAT repeat protein